MKRILTSDGRRYLSAPKVQHVIPTPYRAVILGEEAIVKGWEGGNLRTDKGEFIVHRLSNPQADAEASGVRPRSLSPGNPIQSVRILELATIEPDGKGSWLLNSQSLLPLQTLPGGSRLFGITTSEVLRLFKGEIRGIAWIELVSMGALPVALDTVLSDWHTMRTSPAIRPSFPSPHNQILSLFGGWSEPVWLTRFEKVGSPPSVPHSTANGVRPSRFEDDFSRAVIVDGLGEHQVPIEAELRNLVKTIIHAGGHLPRAQLRKCLRPSAENYQPEKLLESTAGEALLNAGLIGKRKVGRIVIYWAKAQTE